MRVDPHYYVTHTTTHVTERILSLQSSKITPDWAALSHADRHRDITPGHVTKLEAAIDRTVQDVAIPNIEVAPVMVLFDPDDAVLKEADLSRPRRELAYQSFNMRRTSAIATGAAATHRVCASQKCRRTCRRFRSILGTRADAVGVAASFDDVSAVHRALHDADVRVRIAAEAAAGSLHGRRAIVVRDLETMTSDPNPDVVAGALTALGASHTPGALARLTAALDRPSFHETISIGALAGLAADCDERALELIKARTAYGTFELERDAAVHALARCALVLKKPELALRPLIDLATSDPLIGTRNAAAGALGAIDDPAAIPYLQRVAHNDTQEIVRETAQAALLALGRPRPGG